jgi:hypothetical protein
MAFEINGDLSFAKLCIKQLTRAMRGPFTIEKAEAVEICVGVIQRDVEAWVKLHADEQRSSKRT